MPISHCDWQRFIALKNLSEIFYKINRTKTATSGFGGNLNKKNPKPRVVATCSCDQAEDRSTTFSSGVVAFRAALLAVTTTVAIVPVSD